ncbi:peptidoglycan DD-metalloendopeptidase family protein [Marinobacterium rhizophilum]|uniref:Peptidoglycan DD-metalloendopeptidase family protein n=1 Tax=Marinobacterium rhizophilum TaxID=420402 RepID=A0ABY5HPL0_9GAMM|nr:peptidoglycan DD-metalloendopeptidase family protein [Marinobacterium rhizophilum]
MVKRVLVLIVLFGLAACSGGYAPVAERSINSSNGNSNSRPLPESGTYTVRKGDTLYSIAWRYSLDYRELARLNNIDSRYLIYVGQTLRLQTKPTAVTKTSPVRPGLPLVVKPLAGKDVGAGTTAGNSSTAPASVKPPEPTLSVKAPIKPPAVPSDRLTWRWPAQGPLLNGFSSTATKGINIAGKAGDPVVAAGSGRVVYAGDGLRGYGILVIINHNQEFLSAYAHNSRVFVKENDMVNGGDKIAEVGSSGAARDMLHFEIRRDGQPVDPLRYLPKR